jgi:hypothetical protein
MNHQIDHAARDARRGFEFVDWAAELFRKLGYEVEKEIKIAGVGVDLLVKRDGVSTPVEITMSQDLRRLMQTAARLQSIRETAPEYDTPIIVALTVLAKAPKAWVEGTSEAQLWDAAILYEKTKPFKRLAERLSLFVEGPPSGTGGPPNSAYTDEGNALIERLIHHEDHGGSPSDYEKLCMEVMAFLFDPYLYGFESQMKTADNANRYDFICRILPGNPFWDAVRTDFRTRSILFECKNYERPITADQVYSTERYLFSGALRTVCFLISRKGPDEGCQRAAQGALRESGKLVLLLSNADLTEMVRLRADQDGPTNYLDERIWQFIVTLPR